MFSVAFVKREFGDYLFSIKMFLTTRISTIQSVIVAEVSICAVLAAAAPAAATIFINYDCADDALVYSQMPNS